MSAGLLTTSESSEPLLCPYCFRQLHWASTRWLAHGVFECERCGQFPDFRVSRRETPASEPPPLFDSALIPTSSKNERPAQHKPAPSAD